MSYYYWRQPHKPFVLQARSSVPRRIPPCAIRFCLVQLSFAREGLICRRDCAPGGAFVCGESPGGCGAFLFHKASTGRMSLFFVRKRSQNASWQLLLRFEYWDFMTPQTGFHEHYWSNWLDFHKTRYFLGSFFSNQKDGDRGGGLCLGPKEPPVGPFWILWQQIFFSPKDFTILTLCLAHSHRLYLSLVLSLSLVVLFVANLF